MAPTDSSKAANEPIPLLKWLAEVLAHFTRATASDAPEPANPALERYFCHVCKKKNDDLRISFARGEKCVVCGHGGCSYCRQYRRMTNEVLGVRK